jgi:hypothetical protein
MMTDGLPASTAMLLHRYFGGPPCRFSSCACHGSAELHQAAVMLRMLEALKSGCCPTVRSLRENVDSAEPAEFMGMQTTAQGSQPQQPGSALSTGFMLLQQQDAACGMRDTQVSGRKASSDQIHVGVL